MYQKKTSELEEILENTRPGEIGAYVEENRSETLTSERDFMRFMNEMLIRKGLTRQEVLLRADISQGYGYKLFSEEKTTRQRDVILRICYAAEFTLQETQQCLRIYRMETLYARDPRDALLMTCFNERPGGILELNELLLKNHMPPLRSSGVQN